jgi:aspartyl-tRNA(Asn)/glutamyl-tRNA(Gln) amidotransferase subunit C
MQSTEITRMALDKEAVGRIAHLARLGVDESEYDTYARNLSSILSFVEQLNAVDTRGVEPMAHPMDASQRLRLFPNWLPVCAAVSSAAKR